MAKPATLTLKLVPYRDLDPAEKEAVHEWLNQHGIDHTTVPVDDPWSLDASTNEVRIPVFRTRNGEFYLDEHGEPARAVVRRVLRRPIPWRRSAEWELGEGWNAFWAIERWEKR